MPWVKIDDHFDEHPKFARAGPLGIALWVAGLAYCNRNLTDGFIPWTKARGLLTWQFLGPETNDRGEHKVWTISVGSGMVGNDVDSEFVIVQLVLAGLWEEVDDGYLVHDYADYQPTKDEVEAERLKKQAAGRAGGQASAQARGQAGATARAQAKSKPVPGPVPGKERAPLPPTKNGRTKEQEDSSVWVLAASWYEAIDQPPRNMTNADREAAGELVEQGATADEASKVVAWMRACRFHGHPGRGVKGWLEKRARYLDELRNGCSCGDQGRASVSVVGRAIPNRTGLPPNAPVPAAS